MTDADAERQFHRVDELAARLRARAVLLFVFASLTALILVQTVVSWLPKGLWNSPGSRLPLVFTGLLLIGFCRLAMLAVRAHRRLDPDELIPEIETSTGLRSGELAGARELAEVPPGGSQSLAIRQRARVAAKLVGRKDMELAPSRMDRSRRQLRMSALGSALAFLCLAATVGVRPSETFAAASALARPWRLAFPPPPPAMRVELVGGPVLRGERARVRVHAPERRVVRLKWRVEGEPVRTAGVSVDGRRGVAEGETGPVRVRMSVWAEDMDGRGSDTLVVLPVDPLLTTDLRVIVIPPAWAGGKADTLSSPLPTLMIQPGASILVSGRTNHLLRAGALVSIPDRTVVPVVVTQDRFETELRPVEDGSWRFELTPAAEVPGVRLPPPLEIDVLRDGAPVVRVIRPGRDVVMADDSSLPLVVDASDDVGIQRIELEMWRVSATGVRTEMASERLAEASGELRKIVQSEIPLTGMSLAPGDTLFYQIRVRDGNPATPHGSSRIWRVIMPSIEELRRSATEEMSGLAETADAMSDQVSDLGERAREASAGISPEGSQDGSAFRSTEAARAVEQLGRELERQLEELEREITGLERRLEVSPVSEPSLRHRLEELGELIQELRESGLSERLRALEEALRGLNPGAVREALDGVSDQSRDLARQVDEAADLMERVATEQATRDAALEAEELSERQIRAAEAYTGSERWAEIEAGLASEAEDLAARLEELGERLEANGADRSADSVGAAEAALRESIEAMQEAVKGSGGDRVRDGDSPESQSGTSPGNSLKDGSQAARDAASSLEEASRQMNEAVRSLSADFRQEAVDALDGASRQALDLAREQADLAERMQSGDIGREMAGRQDALARGLDQVLTALSDASRKSALVDRKVGPTASEARDRLQTLSWQLSDGQAAPGAASAEGRRLAEQLNELAGRLRASRKAMEGAESGTGLEEAMERLSRLSEAQSGLNRDVGALMMLNGAGVPIPAEMESIAARQQRIAEQLRALAEQQGAESLPARPEVLAAEADEIARTVRESGIDPETVARQERLFRRLLDAGRTLERDPDPNRRESRTAGAVELRIPEELPVGALSGPRYPYPDEEALRSVSPGARRLILDYFDRLNRSGNP
ncbi:MAG: hypothetical protein ACWGON_03785 [Gemmatimonadota bacterium]